MAFAISAKRIHCPNCNYEGKARMKGSGCGLGLLWLVLVFVSFAFWPLFIAAGLMLMWLVFKPADQVCPKCGWEHPVPLKKIAQRRRFFL